MVDTDYAIGDAPLRIDWRRPERYDDTVTSSPSSVGVCGCCACRAASCRLERF
jgi:hypothetical protein